MTPPNDIRPVRPSVPGPLEAWKHDRDDRHDHDQEDEWELERLERWSPGETYEPQFPGGLSNL